MLRKTTLLLIFLSLIFAGCNKKAIDVDNNNDDDFFVDDDPFITLPIVMTAEYNLVDYDEEDVFHPFHGRSPIGLNFGKYDAVSQRYFNEDTGELTGYSIQSIDTSYSYQILMMLQIREGSSYNDLIVGEYGLDHPDITFSFVFSGVEDTDGFYMFSDITDDFEIEFNGELVVPKGKIIISKINNTEIEGSFEFDGYYNFANPDYIRKAIIRNGVFSGSIIQNP